MKFRYYYISHPDETLGIIESKNLNQAIKKSSKIKQLPEEKFLRIFNVEEYEE